MKRTEKKLIVQNDALVSSEPEQRSHYIEITKFTDNVETDKFYIPVIDVRDGKEQRDIVNRIERATNQSKYMRPTFSVIGRCYQASHKKDAQVA